MDHRHEETESFGAHHFVRVSLLPKADKKMNESESRNEKDSEPQLPAESPESAQHNRRRRNRPRHLETSVNMDELRELIALIQENGFAEFELEREGFRIHVRRDAEVGVADEGGGSISAAESDTDATRTEPARSPESPAKGATTPAHPGARAETAASEDQDLYMIPSPIVGTFYRSPSPNADPFVKIGSKVEAESVVCIIEAMKLMNEIQAETTGEVVKIYVENGQPVEYGQPLFGIKR